MQEFDPKTGKPVKSTEGKWFFWNTIYGRDGEHGTPYMLRFGIGRLRFHIFYRGDHDPDPHDHPWAFWTFPLTSYVEEVYTPISIDPELNGEMRASYRSNVQLVRRFRFHYRDATHTHRVLGRWNGKICLNDDRPIFEPDYEEGKIFTVVWRTGKARKWGFLKNRDGKWCWVAWREYVFGGGKDAPCQ